MSARIIAVANQKGGVGKTVTSINVAACMAGRGRRTLLIDLDPQGHCGVGLGIDIEQLEGTSYDLLCDRASSVEDLAFQPVDELESLSLIPANLSLALAERELNRDHGLPNLALATKLRDVKEDFDEIILDCPPALSKLSLNAFLACDLVVIPVGVGFFSIQGLRMLAETLKDISEETGLDYEVRCLITRFRSGQTVSRDVHDAATQMFGDYCFSTVIRENVDVEKSVGAQLPLVVFNRACIAARDYDDLIDELLGLRPRPGASADNDQTDRNVLAPPRGMSGESSTEADAPADDQVIGDGQ